jgi:hypothetical protein
MPVPSAGGDRAYTRVTAVDRARFNLRYRVSPGVWAVGSHWARLPPTVRTILTVVCPVFDAPGRVDHLFRG